jgi:FixJ family two-component response regulator
VPHAIAALHRDDLFPPTILITGRLDATISRRADQLGVHAILEKPFPAARLVTLIRGLLYRPQ